MFQVEMVHMPQEEENGGDPTKWVIGSRVAFPERQPVSRNGRRDLPKGLPLPLPHIPPLWHPFLQSLQSYRRVCISFTISNDSNIALRLPTSSNIHFQPKFLPVLPTPRCWLDGHVRFATSLHLWCMHFSPWMLYLNKRLKVKNLRGSSQRYGLKLAMLN